MHITFSFTRLLRLPCAAALAALASSSAAAQGNHSPEWNFSGFGTVGAAHASTRNADFTSSILKHSGAGHTRRWSPHVDSRLGLQMDVAFNARWSAVVQTISEQRVDGSYKPVLEWANIKYQITPDLSLRVGRIAVPIFLAADYRKIGYAYPWIRMPAEVYNAIPVTVSDGVDASYRWSHGELKNVTQVFFGRTNKPAWNNSTLKADGTTGLSHTASWRHTTARLAIATNSLSIDLARDLFNAYRQFGAPGIALAERFEVDHRRVHAINAGLSYDPGAWFATGELSRVKTSASYLGDTYTGYVGAGYRFGEFTPYLVYARVDPDSAITDPGLATGGMAPPAAAAGAYLNGQLNQLLSTIAAQSTASAGVRWDVKPGVALTVQYDRAHPGAGSRGTFINVQPGFESAGAVHVASAALNFVF